MEAGEDAVGGAEEDGEAEGEEVGSVAEGGEYVPWDLKVFATDLDDGFRIEELGDEAGYYIIFEHRLFKHIMVTNIQL